MWIARLKWFKGNRDGLVGWYLDKITGGTARAKGEYSMQRAKLQNGASKQARKATGVMHMQGVKKLTNIG
jgi:hypothetical protein